MRGPAFLYGSVRVVVPKINVWIGLLGFVLAYAGMLSGYSLLLAIGVGALGVVTIGVSCHWLAQWRFNRKAKDWPVQVQVMLGPEGERIAFVTALGGDVSTIILPDDYNPEDDGGLWLIEQVAPSLRALIADDDEADD
jgi:hypothetical protein